MSDTIFNPTTGNTAFKLTSDDKINFIAPVQLGGVDLTVTAAELNALDGVTATAAQIEKLATVTASAAELNFLDDSVAGTAVASRAAVLGTNKELTEVHAVKLYLGAAAGTEVTKTAADLNAVVVGAAGGYKLARGVAAIDAASKDVATGLTTVVAAVVSMVGDPDMNHMYSSVTVGDQAGAPAAGSIRIKSWKPTAVDNCTPVAAGVTFCNVSWIAIGT